MTRNRRREKGPAPAQQYRKASEKTFATYTEAADFRDQHPKAERIRVRRRSDTRFDVVFYDKIAAN